MNAVMAHHEVVVTNPTAHEVAGATIGRQTDVWIPLLSATFAGLRMAVEMAPVWKLRDEGCRESAPARVAVRVRD
jgi:hypothetical protein